MRYVIFAVVVLLCSRFQAQKNDFSTCVGKVSLTTNTPYSLQFSGKKGLDKNRVYGYMNNINVSRNQIWTSFEPGKSGKLQIKCKSEVDTFHLLIFKSTVGDGCLNLALKKAEPLFIKTSTECKQLDKVSVDLQEGFEYIVLFIAEEKVKKSVDFELNFQPLSEKGTEYLDTLTMNLVYNKTAPIYALHVIDEKTKKPIRARISLQTQTNIDGTYFASDLWLNLTRNIRSGTIKIDAEGYNSKDLLNYKIASTGIQHDTIKLTTFKRGSVAKLDEIYFAPGLSTILDESYPRLLRLRDFLVLNPNIKIEIQGHVNDDKGIGLFMMRLSKKRAERIVDFLVESGINPERLTAIGFGSAKPVYPKPENEAEKEANRRVEILIR